MNKSKTGSWSDNLNSEEVIYSKKCANELSHINSWNTFLNSPQIKTAIYLEADHNRSYEELISLKSALFEIRFAYLIQKSELSAKYEYKADTNGNKTVDFCVFGNTIGSKNILIELSSLRESDIQKNATIQTLDGIWSTCLDGNDDVSEYFKVQMVLCEKAEKFPTKTSDDIFNAILLDMRAPNLGIFDQYDYINILLGSHYVEDFYKRYTKQNGLFPGIFCEEHPGSNDLKHLTSVTHFFGFVIEKEYNRNELEREIFWYQNPNIIINNDFNLKNVFKEPKLSNH